MSPWGRWTHDILVALCLIPAVTWAAEVKIVFWHSRLNTDEVAKIAQDFTKNTRVGVDVSRIGLPDFKSSLLRSAADKALPDVALVPSDFLSMDKELNFSRTPTLHNKELMPNASAAGHYEGKMVGVPVTWGSHMMLYYNRSLVAKPAKTFAEMERQAQELKRRNIKTLGMNFGEMYWLVPFLGAYGGWPLDDRSRIDLNTPAMAQALDFYFGLANKGLTLKECRADCTQERFAKGEFAYAMSGDWSFRDLSDKMGSNLGVTTLPSIGKRTLRPMFSSYVLVFPNDALNGPKREALLKFARYMQSLEVQRRWFHETGLLPVNARVFREVKAKADRNTKASLEQLRTSRAMPNDRSMAFAWEGMARGFSGMYRGYMTAAQAAAMMQNHAEKVAKRAGE